MGLSMVVNRRKENNLSIKFLLLDLKEEWGFNTVEVFQEINKLTCLLLDNRIFMTIATKSGQCSCLLDEKQLVGF